MCCFSKDCDAINEICCKFYSNHSIKTDNYRTDFRVGDKICCTKNGKVVDLLQEAQKKSRKKNIPGTEEEDDGLKLCNGEIFFIRDVRFTCRITYTILYF